MAIEPGKHRTRRVLAATALPFAARVRHIGAKMGTDAGTKAKRRLEG